MDLENVDLKKAIPASELSSKLKNLKWITPFSYSKNPKEEIDFLKEVITQLKADKRNKTVVTHYQFLSLLLEEDLNILNRWYLWDNNTHPTEDHKYFNIYKEMVNKNVIKNKIQVIYLLGQDNDFLFKNVKNYFTNVCFKSKTLEEKRFSMHELINCENK
jgi:hypothetical protein